jgi:predicted nucleic acid-binding protein
MHRDRLERCVTARERLVTDAEVLQEVLHRYVAISRRDAIQPCFDIILGIVDDVFPVSRGSVEQAHAIILGNPSLSARDAVHLAVMRQHGIERILTFDSGFDGIPGVSRMHS